MGRAQEGDDVDHDNLFDRRMLEQLPRRRQLAAEQQVAEADVLQQRAHLLEAEVLLARRVLVGPVVELAEEPVRPVVLRQQLAEARVAADVVLVGRVRELLGQRRVVDARHRHERLHHHHERAGQQEQAREGVEQPLAVRELGEVRVGAAVGGGAMVSQEVMLERGRGGASTAGFGCLYNLRVSSR